jgi:hypothetical protein
MKKAFHHSTSDFLVHMPSTTIISGQGARPYIKYTSSYSKDFGHPRFLHFRIFSSIFEFQLKDGNGPNILAKHLISKKSPQQINLVSKKSIDKNLVSKKKFSKKFYHM